MPLFDVIIICQHLITSVIGLIGNFLVLTVYQKKLKDNESITFIIIHLALTDFLCCAVLIPINCYHELNIGKITSDFMCKFHSFLNIINITYSCLLMTLVAFERFFCIVYPFKKIVTVPRAKVILTILFLLCTGIALAGCLSIGIYHRAYLVNNLNPNSLNKTNQSAFIQIQSNYYYNYEKGIEFFLLNDTSETLVFDYNLRRKRDVAAVAKPEAIDFKKRIFVTSEHNPIKDGNYPSNWIPTTDCFPNDQIISIRLFPYIRLFQNLIVVFCFSIIFIVYAFLCVVVSKRRNLKANRENYYKEILHRSRQNTSFKTETTLSRNNSFFVCLYPNNCSISSHGCEKSVPEPHKDPNSQEVCELKFLKETSDQIEAFSRIDINEDYSEDELNNKSTQTKNSTIVSFKKLDKKQKSTILEEDENEETVVLQKRKKLAKNDKNGFKMNIYASKIPSSNYLVANLKTAFMLFVVTVIMAVVYTPALLTSVGMVDYNPLHWNLIYINNAANPLIYSFLNSNFRKSLKNTLKRFSNRIFNGKKSNS
ncbi:muscarinic acetylcholine receptor M2-like [Brachionus plicatilis]|uniref:Muscarinic acetylcholine receptor M2-like n=1 Tax=Brachionus plicatilis TaxID=10195 RepID=A0A3M7QJX0_BRAPC|nr:muscarinic acetylcholine receptor M2-like [Brachionus plicatilis]